MENIFFSVNPCPQCNSKQAYTKISPKGQVLICCVGCEGIRFKSSWM
jgi:hypothetical protein